MLSGDEMAMEENVARKNNQGHEKRAGLNWAAVSKHDILAFAYLMGQKELPRRQG